MTTNDTKVISDNHVYPLDELQTLLEKQVELARQGNIREVEFLSKQASSIVEQIIQTGTHHCPEDILKAEQRKKLGKLYEDLYLAISVQKAEVCTELKQVRKGKKTMQAYCSHI
jgi:translation initiation factor IF-2